MPQSPGHRPASRSRTDPRVAFMSRLKEIGSALDLGISLSEIHASLGLEDRISYSQFTRLTRRFYPDAVQLYRIKPKPLFRRGAPPITSAPAVQFADGDDPDDYPDLPPPGFG